MDKIAQILQRLPRDNMSTSSSYSGSATPFKVQVNFDLPIFEGQIDADVVDKWLNMLEGYFFVHYFSIWKILFSLFSKPPPMSRTGGKPTASRRMKIRLTIFSRTHLGFILDVIKEQYCWDFLFESNRQKSLKDDNNRDSVPRLAPGCWEGVNASYIWCEGVMRLLDSLFYITGNHSDVG